MKINTQNRIARILIYGGFVSFISILIISRIAFGIIEKNLVNSSFQEMEQSASAYATEVRNLLNNNQKIIRVISKQLAAEDNLNPETVLPIINRYPQDGIIKEVNLLYPDDRILSSSGKSVGDENKIFFDYESKFGSHVSDQRVNENDLNNSYIRVYEPVKKNNQIIAILYGIVDLRYADNICIRSINDYNSERIYLVDGNSKDVIIDCRDNKLTDIRNLVSYCNFGKGSNGETFLQCLKNMAVTYNYVYNKYNSSYYYIYSRPANINDWSVVISVPESAILENAYYINIIMIVIIVVLILLFGSIVTVVAATANKQNIRQKNRTELLKKKSDTIVSALSADYVSVLLVNLDNDTFSVLRKSNLPQDIAEQTIEHSYSKVMEYFIRNYVVEQEQTSIRNISSKPYLLNRFKEEKDFAVRFKSLPIGDDNNEYYEFHFVDVSNSPDEHIMVLGRRCIDNIARNEIAYRTELEETNKRLTQQNDITQCLSNIYTTAYYIDIVADIYSDIANKQNSIAIIDKEETASNILKSFCTNNCKKKHIKPMLKFVNTQKMSTKLANTNIVSKEFEDKKLGWCRGNIIAAKRNSDGIVTHTIFVVQVIDEEKRKEIISQTTLKEALAVASVASNAKTDFLSKMSHDIRTPMNAIINLTSIAKSHIDDKEYTYDCLSKIDNSSQHLLELINEVLDMSRIESGKVELVESPFNLSNLTDNLIDMFRPQANEKNINLLIHIDNITHEDVIGDKLKIQKVFTNFLSNAIKYTPKNGTIHFYIKERPARYEGVSYYEFIFQDNGIGMSKEYLEKIFEPFTRAEDSRVSKIQGTGLGMSIAYNIINMMNGNISVESELGKGSKFTINIFLKHNDTTYYNKQFKNLKLLIVDKDEAMLKNVSSTLHKFGIICDCTSDSQKAVDKIINESKSGNGYYAILLDPRLAYINDKALNQIILDSLGKDSSPVFVLAAFDVARAHNLASKIGIEHIVSKPLFASKLSKLFDNITNNINSEEKSNPINELNSIDFSDKRILIVEDNELNLEILQEILETTKVKTESAENGQIAVDMFNNSDEYYYDLIFMDIQMPVLNGYEATKAIRALPRADAKTIPIIAMTANAFADDIKMAEDVGMNEHLSKPVDLKKLIKSLTHWLY